MASIGKGGPVVTLINVHICRPQDQERLVSLLVEGVEAIYRHVPGFVSASIHKSLDGVRVTNYAQYESQEAVAAAWSHPAVPAFAERVGLLVVSFDAHLYEVADVIPPQRSDTPR